ncbi:hypothetical protein BC940DRAFT_252110 [Gongronella butleri]|nr:hypothetical protein BC940DRAFT_252110 [Gongronella butleri]
MVTLEAVQALLNDLSTLFQLAVSILGLVAVLLPLLRTLPFYYALVHALDVAVTLAGHLLSRPWATLTFLLSSTDTLFSKGVSDLALTCHASNTRPPPPWVAGIVNTGNSCYLNSVLQSLSSLPTLHQHLEACGDSAVSSALGMTLRRLAAPQSRRSSIHPYHLVHALAKTHASFGRRSRFSLFSHDQQDAQEFFQLLIGALDTELNKEATAASSSTASSPTPTPSSSSSTSSTSSSSSPSPASPPPPPSTPHRHHHHHHQHGGLSDLLKDASLNRVIGASTASLKVTHSPLSGLLASRLSCVKCGYTGAIRHFPFNNVQLSLPNAYSVTIEQSLRQFTAIEYLRDASCRQCALLAAIGRAQETNKVLQQQLKRAGTNKDEKRRVLGRVVALDRKRRALEERLRVHAMDSSEDEEDDTTSSSSSNSSNGNSSNESDESKESEEEEDALRWVNQRVSVRRTISAQSTIQVMFAKMPRVLCLHVTRSAVHHASGMVLKNACQLHFDQYLDLTPYVTDGTLHTEATKSLSRSPAQQQQQMQQLPPVQPETDNDRFIYRLMSVVVHYGTHSYGHYIAYKRRIVPTHCTCSKCRSRRKNTDASPSEWHIQPSWYRISDSKVDQCATDDVLAANPYMLMYERIDPTTDPLYLEWLDTCRSQQMRHNQTDTVYTSDEEDDVDDDDTDDTDEDDDDDDDTSSTDRQPTASPSTPDEQAHDDFSRYYTTVSTGSLEAMEIANSLLMMDQEEAA